MRIISIRLPTSLHEGIREAARREETSVKQFIAAATEEKLAPGNTEECPTKRAQRSDRYQFEAALSRVPDHPADPDDAI